MTKVFQRGASAPKVESDSESDSPSDEEHSDKDHPQPGQPQRLVVPPLPPLLDGKCGQTAKPLPPRLDCVHEDSMLSGDLLSSSDDEDDEELLIESIEHPEQMSCRSTLVPLSERSVLKSEAATHISMELTAMSKGSRCLSVGGLGALTGGAGGAVVGMLSGIIPAPLTFGLSVPINAGIGSISGMIFGTAGGLLCQSLDVLSIEAVEGQSQEDLIRGPETFRTATSSSAPGLLVKFSTAGVTSDDSERASPQTARADLIASSTLRGGLALGSLGGASGSAVGGFVGAALGLPPAVLTFGLSVPVCATLGSSVGLCVGTLAGSSVGMIGGCLYGRSKALPDSASEGQSGLQAATTALSER